MVAVLPLGAYSHDMDTSFGAEMMTLKSTLTVSLSDVMRYILSLTLPGTEPGTFTISVLSVV